MENINKMIEALDDKSTVADFAVIMKKFEEDTTASLEKKNAEITALSEKVQEVMEASIKRSAEKHILTVSEMNNKFFHAAVQKGASVADVYKYEGKMIRNDSEWSEGNWNIGKSIPANMEEKAALGTVLRGDATTGSYLVPVLYEKEIYRLAATASKMMGKVTTVDMLARDIYWPAELTVPDLTWVTDETTGKTESGPTFTQVHLVCETCAAWVTITDELLEDSVINLGDFFKLQYSERWGKEFDKQVLNSAAAPFTGMVNNTSCSRLNMGEGKTDFQNVEFDDLVDLETYLSAQAGEAALNDAKFILHRKVFNILKKKTDDVGAPLYMKAAEGVPATIYGYPYIIADQMPSTSAVSTGFIILGNPKYWLHGNRVGIQFRTYDNTIRNLDYDQIFYKFRNRQGFVGAIPKAIGVLMTAPS